MAQLTAAGNRMVFATVALPNDASVRLHERLGFDQVGLLPDIAEKFGQTWSTGLLHEEAGLTAPRLTVLWSVRRRDC